ncbi:helix-turn-helix domain-containing protein [Muricauda sp. JGD-17]|uniref:Helix-turn-helix domain-containing protein n=1 Tax=Flagellimonas ochracea TaxID=2696472 RepID=A0A964WY53_9FLAO|nr:helix-turn-helix domain-containing protein [Allomuricauda ochracea]NAY92861.1 helix-turn-helix domain-containing protein [Allomuricauda ochracea]
MRKLLTTFFSNKKVPSDELNNLMTCKYVKSGLTPEEAFEIKQKIVLALEEDRLFKDGSIGLNELSQHIEKDRYKVSQVLNEYLQKNFYALLNHYRIKEAQNLLLTQPMLSVKAVMYEVGFNSKTSFYCAFKKETGLSPNDYRNLVRYAS